MKRHSLSFLLYIYINCIVVFLFSRIFYSYCIIHILVSCIRHFFRLSSLFPPLLTPSDPCEVCCVVYMWWFTLSSAHTLAILISGSLYSALSRHFCHLSFFIYFNSTVQL